MSPINVEAIGLLQENGQTCGARDVDQIDGAEYAVTAQVVINASGPWLDLVRRFDGAQEPVLRTTRDTHIVVPRVNVGEEAFYLSSGRDERLFFVIPWGEMSLIGTTDVDFSGLADAVEPTEEAIAYLLEESARHLQGVGLTRDCVVSAFAGLRPLVRDGNAEHASKVSREHSILYSPSGLMSVAGGKYTTYRAVA